MEIENKEISKICEKLIKIDTIADGSCLIHAVLKSCSPEYRENGNIEFRRKICTDIRREISELITSPNERFKTPEDVSNLVRTIYNTESPKHFMEFLNCAYNYTSPYIAFPNEPLPYKNQNKYYCIDTYRSYIEDYKQYILNFYNKIESKTVEMPKTPIPNIGCWLHEPEMYLSVLDEKNVELINQAYKEVEEKVNYEIEQLKFILENKLGYELYLPTKFNQNVIESLLEDKQDIPEGLYKDYDYNCYLFTSCGGAQLNRFQWEYCKVEGLMCFGNIVSHINSNNFIGDMDALAYIPELMGVNLIIMDFNTGQVINIYDYSKNNGYVLIHNNNNVHFETLGIKSNDIIETYFTEDHPIVREAYESKNRENKQIDFTVLEPKVINFLNPEPKTKTLIDILREELEDVADVEIVNNDLGYAYIRYKQTPKTVYRFYIDKSGNITYGKIPIKIQNHIKHIIEKNI